MNQRALGSVVDHMATVAKRVLYAGRVQGVGFRYTTQRLAAGRPVAGSVRNLPTGDVELVVEGDDSEVAAFLAAVAERLAPYMMGCDVSDVAVAGREGFRILQ
jgi:acylphosphatase